ncbi:hypothetical protein DH2020_005218 [Rehmannia glutinosa]|uniref:Uncharacterized protein n=1 Tax=Rehmannia glutinosa TaxID=99300 RepID=A0ABR0W3B9_REHGL
MNTLVQGYLAATNDFHLNYGPKSVLSESSSSPVPTNVDESSSSSSSEGESFKENDHSDAILKFISQMLMEEEDLENKPCMLHDCLALQATEKSLFDVLNNNINRDENVDSPNSEISSVDGFVESNNWSHNNEKKNRYRDDIGFMQEQRSNKHLALNVAESDPLEMYDNVLLCSRSDRTMCIGSERIGVKKKSQQKRGRPKGSNKQGIVKEVVDLRSLLMQCAQAVASFDCRTVNDLLVRIRHHSSPQGDGMERTAHYFANALEARLAGTGTASYAAFISKRISAAEILKAYKTFITACPFKKMSNLLANRTINKLASNATTLHIIDFGILYGYQWPCLIQALSERAGGPPMLRITGIDFPQPGFRPAERVEDTGRRLKNYCERFRVPFEYNALAQKWETIKLEDLKIEDNEFVVVNSLYRLHNVADETVMVNSPRDSVLNLIKRINPDMFIHGVINGTYNTPFFVTRFREAMFHFSSMFDMFEATIPREDPNRILFEQQVFGKDAMNIIACEGTERIERPETYKQWQVRNVRAGFRQVPLDREIVKYVRSKVKREYHKDFSVDEDGKWMLQGWKGRVIKAISCWQPSNK